MGLVPLAIASIVASTAGAGVAAYSQNQAGKAQQSLANYNADVTKTAADYNADVITRTADYNATLTTQTADANANRVLRAADYNARVNEQNAGVALEDSAVLANLQRTNNAHVLAAQRAKIGASGVVAGTGSPLLLEAAQAGYAEMAALQTERAGQVRSQAFSQEALTQRWQAGEDASAMRTQAANDAAAMRWQAGNQSAMTRYTGKSQSTLDVMGGSAARAAGSLGATATLIQGAGKTAGSIYGIYG